MRTQGDDIAEVLALLGVEPVWNAQSRRLAGSSRFRSERLGRPRIDVTLRISGFFRDAFPHLIQLVDRAVELVVPLDEPLDQNFPRKHYLAELARTSATCRIEDVEAQARYRIFGAKPGSLWRRHPAPDRDAELETDQDFARSSSSGAAMPTPRDATASMRATSSPIG